MNSINLIIFFFIFTVLKICYEFYSIYKLTHFDEKCFSFKKIIVDKFNYNDHYNNNYYINSQMDISEFMKNNYKCMFHKFNPNSHIVNNEIKSEIIFKCFC
jgi:hypothetical protein